MKIFTGWTVFTCAVICVGFLVPMFSPAAPSSLPARANTADYLLRGPSETSIYFHATYNDSGRSCPGGKTGTIFGSSSALMQVCARTLVGCQMEGVCQVQRGFETRTFNYQRMQNGRAIFFELGAGDCVYGYGVQSSCLDPFYTLAADLRYHRPGEVLFFPLLRGLMLPSGALHSGFMIVRDTGRRIIGPHRFDFYSGSYQWNDPKNSFNNLGLSQSKGKFIYYKVSGETADRFLKLRNYPKLP